MANTTHYTTIFDTKVEMIADWSQSASPIWAKFGDEADSYCTGRQVADFGHVAWRAMKWLLEEYVSDGGDDPEDYEKEIDAAIEAMTDINLGDMDDDDLLEHLGDIRELRVDDTETPSWIDDNGNVWKLPCKCHWVDNDPHGRMVAWTDSHEAGIEDITVLESGVNFHEWGRSIAEDLGTFFDECTCPDCDNNIDWGSLQTGGPSGGLFQEGSCECDGRTWTRSEYGSEWNTGYSDEDESAPHSSPVIRM